MQIWMCNFFLKGEIIFMVHFNVYNACSSDNLNDLKYLLELYPGYTLREVKIEYLNI